MTDTMTQRERPPVGEVLTSESARLVEPGDWLRRRDGTVVQTCVFLDGADLGETFLGRPDSSGWIPNPGFNPAPGMRVDVRFSKGAAERLGYISDEWTWPVGESRLADITHWRPSIAAQPAATPETQGERRYETRMAYHPETGFGLAVAEIAPPPPPNPSEGTVVADLTDLFDRLDSILVEESPMHPFGCATWEESSRIAIDMAKDTIRALSRAEAAQPAKESISHQIEMAVVRETLRQAVVPPAEECGAACDCTADCERAYAVGAAQPVAGREEEYASGCGYTGRDFGAPYNDSTCIDGFLWDLDSCDEPGGGLTQGGDIPCPKCNPGAATLPTPPTGEG